MHSMSSSVKKISDEDRDGFPLSFAVLDFRLLSFSSSTLERVIERMSLRGALSSLFFSDRMMEIRRFTRSRMNRSISLDSRFILRQKNGFSLCRGFLNPAPIMLVRSRKASRVSIPPLSSAELYPQSSPKATWAMTSEVKSMALEHISVGFPLAMSFFSQHSSIRSHFRAIVLTVPFRYSGENPGLKTRRWWDHSDPSIATMLFLPINGTTLEYVGDFGKALPLPFLALLWRTCLARATSPTTIIRPKKGISNMTTLLLSFCIHCKNTTS
mmetsp:Transcript_20552/g.48381  ORF Transcript_20552/g.48381 Transcript_20552/m.48381 type:complete len:270 (-) Transcript_20552:408-1217(-)